MDQIQDLNEGLRRAVKGLDSALAHVDYLSPVGADVKTIKHQQEDLKVKQEG